MLQIDEQVLFAMDVNELRRKRDKLDIGDAQRLMLIMARWMGGSKFPNIAQLDDEDFRKKWTFAVHDCTARAQQADKNWLQKKINELRSRV